MADPHKPEFRKAQSADLDRVFDMFTAVIAEMERNGIHQWDELYPDRQILAEDIEKNELTVGILDGEIACAYVVNSECDEEYENGEWKYPDTSFCVIHRLCVSPQFQNRGLGAKTVTHIETQLRKENVETIRLDAYTLNPYALRLYDRLGYVRVGTVEWRKGRFWLMEKKL
ncbi:MAG: GNAT family N-acetyltransferase [Clostridia bacterium]|nr:GNAT family N-acetyltransferase [Clostridia bacterium]